MKRFHRDAEPIPTDAGERRRMVRWLIEHPVWIHKLPDFEGKFHDWNESDFYNCVQIDYFHYVDPSTGGADSVFNAETGKKEWVNDEKLTEFAIRLEAGEPGCHDTDFDFIGPDLEICFLEIATRLAFLYHEDGTQRTEAPGYCTHRVERVDPCEVRFESACVPDTEGFCRQCGWVDGWWNYWLRK